jgi:hypothetical protein
VLLPVVIGPAARAGRRVGPRPAQILPPRDRACQVGRVGGPPAGCVAMP